ncbi:MAG: acylphosphatase [Nitrososphaerota archaeon]
MKAYNVRVYGKVQRVGFRRFVQELGQELGLVGYVKNERDGSVTVFVQGDEAAAARFIESMKSTQPPATVRTVEVEETKTKPRLKYFEISYGRLADELQEGFGAMQAIFLEYWSEFRDYRSEFRDYRSEFREFVKRMDEFSERVTKVLELLTEGTAKSREMLMIIIRDSRETREMLAETMRMLKEVASKIV